MWQSSAVAEWPPVTYRLFLELCPRDGNTPWLLLDSVVAAGADGEQVRLGSRWGCSETDWRGCRMGWEWHERRWIWQKWHGVDSIPSICCLPAPFFPWIWVNNFAGKELRKPLEVGRLTEDWGFKSPFPSQTSWYAHFAGYSMLLLRMAAPTTRGREDWALRFCDDCSQFTCSQFTQICGLPDTYCQLNKYYNSSASAPLLSVGVACFSDKMCFPTCLVSINILYTLLGLSMLFMNENEIQALPSGLHTRRRDRQWKTSEKCSKISLAVLEQHVVSC